MNIDDLKQSPEPNDVECRVCDEQAAAAIEYNSAFIVVFNTMAENRAAT